MKLVTCVLLTLTCFWTVEGAELKIKEELKALADQIEMIKSSHLTDVTRLKKEIQDLKQRPLAHSTSNHERNEQATLQWARASMKELKLEMRELGDSVNNSVLLKQLHSIRNELKQALLESSELAQRARAQEARADKLDVEVMRLRRDGQQARDQLAQLQATVAELGNEIKAREMSELNLESYNDVVESADGDAWTRHAHKLRHNKMMHTQLSRVARAQDQLGEAQRSLQTQLLDVQRRLDHFEEPNWNLLSAKVDLLELETKVLRNEIKNDTQKISDLDKVHSSMLELREDVESIENKVDKTIPEFRKEISKLDINVAQMNAQASYLKEDQENLRQSVKAIAVSVSNAVDRAELDRLALRRLNDSLADLTSRSKQHYYRLNDHILKSEANHDSNLTQTISLPELMGEVKELQPVEHEYEDLVSQLPRDCSGVQGPPGVYLVRPGRAPVETWCAGGGTLLQRRYNGSVEFNRKFSQYVRGFGDPASEFWLGLDAMHRLTINNCSSMRIDMTDIYGGAWYAQYEHFSVGSADSGYVLEVGGFKGNASDAFEYQNHMEFSAVDRDRDISNTHCAGNYEGGWWFSHCQHVNINGKYTLGLTWFDSARNEWIAVATSEMRIFRRPGCS